jgi:hypothetical protein
LLTPKRGCGHRIAAQGIVARNSAALAALSEKFARFSAETLNTAILGGYSVDKFYICRMPAFAGKLNPMIACACHF